MFQTIDRLDRNHSLAVNVSQGQYDQITGAVSVMQNTLKSLSDSFDDFCKTAAHTLQESALASSAQNLNKVEEVQGQILDKLSTVMSSLQAQALPPGTPISQEDNKLTDLQNCNSCLEATHKSNDDSSGGQRQPLVQLDSNVPSLTNRKRPRIDSCCNTALTSQSRTDSRSDYMLSSRPMPSSSPSRTQLTSPSHTKALISHCRKGATPAANLDIDFDTSRASEYQDGGHAWTTISRPYTCSSNQATPTTVHDDTLMASTNSLILDRCSRPSLPVPRVPSSRHSKLQPVHSPSNSYGIPPENATDKGNPSRSSRSGFTRRKTSRPPVKSYMTRRVAQHLNTVLDVHVPEQQGETQIVDSNATDDFSTDHIECLATNSDSTETRKSVQHVGDFDLLIPHQSDAVPASISEWHFPSSNGDTRLVSSQVIALTETTPQTEGFYADQLQRVSTP